jgi:hypothetical protein
MVASPAQDVAKSRETFASFGTSDTKPHLREESECLS